MNYFWLRLFLILALLACVTPLFVVADDSNTLANDPVTRLTADQAVTLGEDKFIDLYEKTTADESNVGMCNAANIFAQLRRYINDRAVVKRSNAQQLLIQQARKCCTDIITAYIEIDEASSGGGTIHRIENADGGIDVETTIGKVILAMEHPKPNAQNKTRAAKTIANLLDELPRLPKAFSGDPAAASWKQENNAAKIKLDSALRRLQRLFKAVPDNGCVALERFASDARKNVSD